MSTERCDHCEMSESYAADCDQAYCVLRGHDVPVDGQCVDFQPDED